MDEQLAGWSFAGGAVDKVYFVAGKSDNGEWLALTSTLIHFGDRVLIQVMNTKGGNDGLASVF